MAVTGCGTHWTGLPPAPSRWRAAPPMNIYTPAEPLARHWRTWALRDGGEIQPPPPVPYDSPAYWREAEEVLRVTRQLTDDQKRIADAWGLGKGSLTPPGVWNRGTRALALEAGLDTARTARLFAALTVAMADALVACWETKFTYWTQRPVSAIRDRLAPNFMPTWSRPLSPAMSPATPRSPARRRRCWRPSSPSDPPN